MPEGSASENTSFRLKPADQDLRSAAMQVLEPEDHDGERTFRLDQEDVDTVLEADGDGNPVHGPFPSGSSTRRAREVFSRRVPEEGFPDFQADIYEAMPPFSDPIERQRPILPGMAVLEHLGYSEERPIGAMSISWDGASHHSTDYRWSDLQEVKGLETEEGRGYEVHKQTPVGEREKTAEAEIRYAEAGAAYNEQKTALAGGFVARRDRSGDFLVSLDIDFNEDFDWDSIDFDAEDFFYIEDERREERFSTTSGRVLDGRSREVAEVEEVYGEIPGYSEIRSAHPEPRSPAARATEAYWSTWQSIVKASNPFLAD